MLRALGSPSPAGVSASSSPLRLHLLLPHHYFRGSCRLVRVQETPPPIVADHHLTQRMIARGAAATVARLVVLEHGGARRHTSWAADSTALARLAAAQQLRSPAMAQQPACPVAATATVLHCTNAAGAGGRRGGNEWVTRGPHMSLRCRPASYVAVNASVVG